MDGRILGKIVSRITRTLLSAESKNISRIRSSSCHDDPVHVVNLRSDTFTMPTPSMKQAMVTTDLGDDVYGEDPTVNKLQEECAALLGKEAALLVPTGTMVLSHCQGHFQEVLLGDQCHIHLYEVGGMSALAGIHPRSVTNKPDGTLDLAELSRKIRNRYDPHYPWTRVICLENTHNKCGGAVISPDYINQVRQIADANDLVMHLDGARLMNAATALGVPPSHITSQFDSISMCFSKGLSCPVGSILAGSQEFIQRALWARKALGGGMRQAGIIAAPMLIALHEIVPLLKEDHMRARKIAQAVADFGDSSVLTVDMDCVQTNIVMLHVRHSTTSRQMCERLSQVTDEELLALGERIQVQMLPFTDTAVRFVTYQGITDVDTNKTIKKLKYVLAEKARA
ncbi:hypothetical protein BaRGS_00001126 [Batillaria attramentaria]|uniref:Aromatic amino acid beta-eliminating lyase/threonine aldolase domain-containing protein n=1 Tax=Batillaria attramentaria TaxID=370345 RepID=A0ABD0M6B0_9CAEN